MAKLTLADVQAGKAVPQPGDRVDDLLYRGGGDPTELSNYQRLDGSDSDAPLSGSIFDYDASASGTPSGDAVPTAPPGGPGAPSSTPPLGVRMLIGSPYLQGVNDRLQSSLETLGPAQQQQIAGRIPLVNGRMAVGGQYNVINGDKVFETDPSFEPNTSAALTAAILEMNKEGIVPTISTGFRTAAEQQWLRDHPGKNPVAKGPSWHQAGMAVDFNGTKTANFGRIRAIMQKHGFTWGGGFNDPPHFQFGEPRGTNPSPGQMDAVGGD